MKSYIKPCVKAVFTMPEPICDGLVVNSQGDPGDLARRKEDPVEGRYGTGRRLWEDL